MTPRSLPLAARRAAALLLLLLFVMTGWELAAAPLLGLVESRVDEIGLLKAQLEHLRAVAARRPELERQAKLLQAQPSVEGDYWTGPGDVAVGAAVQDLLRKAATGAGGRLKSTSQAETGSEHGMRRVTIRFSQDGTLETMQRTLEAVALAKPALFVDDLIVSATEPGKEFPPNVAVELGITAYMQTPAPP